LAKKPFATNILLFLAVTENTPSWLQNFFHRDEKGCRKYSHNIHKIENIGDCPDLRLGVKIQTFRMGSAIRACPHFVDMDTAAAKELQRAFGS
jgi:hypothetical protein